MDASAKVFIVGHNDILESSLADHFQKKGFASVQTSTETGLSVLSQADVNAFFAKAKPDYVFLSSVRSGGISANLEHPAEFMYENLQAQTNIIHAAYTSGVKKLMYLSGSCAYPKDAQQPIAESSLLTGALESSSESYAVAKIAGAKMCQAYRRQYGFNAIVAVPATLYGPGADVDVETAHVMGALMGKFYRGVRDNVPSVDIWGTGNARREFLYADDFADACEFLMDHYEGEDLINIGCGSDVSIKELAELIQKVSGYSGQLNFDASKPEGAMRKWMDVSRLQNLGWKAKVSLEDGVRQTYASFK